MKIDVSEVLQQFDDKLCGLVSLIRDMPLVHELCDDLPPEKADAELLGLLIGAGISNIIQDKHAFQRSVQETWERREEAADFIAKCTGEDVADCLLEQFDSMFTVSQGVEAKATK